MYCPPRKTCLSILSCIHCLVLSTPCLSHMVVEWMGVGSGVAFSDLLIDLQSWQDRGSLDLESRALRWPHPWISRVCMALRWSHPTSNSKARPGSILHLPQATGVGQAFLSYSLPQLQRVFECLTATVFMTLPLAVEGFRFLGRLESWVSKEFPQWEPFPFPLWPLAEAFSGFSPSSL